MSVVEELKRSVEDASLSDVWSNETCRVYFGAAAFHGFDTEEDQSCIGDVYTYAIECAEALGLITP